MPIKKGGKAKAMQQYTAYVGRMAGPKTKAAMTKVLSAGMTNAKEYAPVEYGTLVNSAFRRIEGSKEAGWTGYCGFAVHYALYLTGTDTYTPLWKPVAPENKEGPGWNPFAKPRFLQLGFTGPLAKEEIQRIIRESYK